MDEAPSKDTFQAVDTDNDGSVSKVELSEFMNSNQDRIWIGEEIKLAALAWYYYYGEYASKFTGASERLLE